MYLTIFLLAIFFAVVASLFNGGLWSNTLMLFNVVMSALLASSFAEPVTMYLMTIGKTYTNVWDILSYWLVFSICMIVFRGLTDAVSRVKVRFKKPVDMAGGIITAVWVGWVMVCFSTMTLHTAPLDRNFMGGAFQPKPDDRMFFGFGPDRQWLGFVHKESLGGLSRGGTADKPNLYEFDPQGEFILKYGERRARLEDLKDIRVN